MLDIMGLMNGDYIVHVVSISRNIILSTGLGSMSPHATSILELGFKVITLPNGKYEGSNVRCKL